MDSNKRKTTEQSSSCLSPKKIKKDTKPETEMQGFPNDRQEQQQEEIFVNENQFAEQQQEEIFVNENQFVEQQQEEIFVNENQFAEQQQEEIFVNEFQFAEQQQGQNFDNENNEQPHNNGQFYKSGKRVELPKHVKQRLDEFTEALNFRFIGDTLEWLSPSETKTLLELTKKLGYEKGGETIDWLLSVRRNRMSYLTQDPGLRTSEQPGEWVAPRGAKRLLEITREIGFSGVGQTMKSLIAMAKYKPLVELTNSLGFQDCRKTLEWLLDQTKQNVAAIKNAGFSAAAPQSASSTMNISPHIPPNQSEIVPVFPYQGGEENTVNSSCYANRISMQPNLSSNFSNYKPVQGSNNNHINTSVDVNNQIQMQYRAQGLKPGYPDLYNEIMQRTMDGSYSDYRENQLQTQYSTGNRAINQGAQLACQILC